MKNETPSPLHPTETAALRIASSKICGGSGFFDKPYLDAAFNGSVFFWDSCMLTPWAKYHQEDLPIHAALNNLYKVQETDGYICREYLPDGTPVWDKGHPIAVNPPILAWAELELFSQKPDSNRLKEVYPKLCAFHRYLHTTYQREDGLYFSDAHGSGMDNISRAPYGWKPDGRGISINPEASVPSVREFIRSRLREDLHWTPEWNQQGRSVDFSAQMALDARQLAIIALHIGYPEQADSWTKEAEILDERINSLCWNQADNCYYDLGYGKQIPRKHIGMFWTLISGTASETAQIQGLNRMLQDPARFNRPVPVPSLSADDPEYSPWGKYWRGGVWAPTTYMVLRGLRAQKQEDLARNIARKLVGAVDQVFEHTGTFWENYAPEFAGYGNPSRADFCGWSALIPIAVRREFL